MTISASVLLPSCRPDHLEDSKHWVISGYQQSPGALSDHPSQAPGYWMFGRGLRISFPVCKKTEIGPGLTIWQKTNPKKLQLTTSQRFVNSHRHRTCCILLKLSDSGQQYWGGKGQRWKPVSQKLEQVQINYPNPSCMLYTVLSVAEVGCVMLEFWHANMLLHNINP